MENTKFNYIVGIDISKNTFDVALVKNRNQDSSNEFTNDLTGFEKLFSWLKSKNINTNEVLFCAEKTGIYGIKLVEYISKNKCKIWLEDPIKISKSQGLKRGKSDKVDAVRIAKYALRFQDKLQLWEPNDEIYEKMGYLFSLRERLVVVVGILERFLFESKDILKSDVQNMLETICLLPISCLKSRIKTVDKKLANLLKENKKINRKYKIAASVKGIGKQTAIYLLIITRGFTKIKTARKCSCFCGIAPFEFSSGISVKGRTKVSHFGNKKLKKLLHMGALSIISQKKGVEYEYYSRKVSEGKHKMKVINALRNKILGRVFSCIKDDREYEAEYEVKCKKAI